MNFVNMDRDTYAACLQLTIAETESLHARVQDVGDGKATIGWGYTFNRNDNHAIWQASGINLTDAQWHEIRAMQHRHRTRPGWAWHLAASSAQQKPTSCSSHRRTPTPPMPTHWACQLRASGWQ